MAPVQQQLLPEPAENPEIQQLTDELLDLSTATDEVDNDAECQMMKVDEDSSEETVDARYVATNGVISRENRNRESSAHPTAAFKIVCNNIDKKV